MRGHLAIDIPEGLAVEPRNRACNERRVSKNKIRSLLAPNHAAFHEADYLLPIIVPAPTQLPLA